MAGSIGEGDFPQWGTHWPGEAGCQGFIPGQKEARDNQRLGCCVLAVVPCEGIIDDYLNS